MTIGSIIAEIGKIKKDFENEVTVANKFMEEKELSEDLRNKIR
jgi:hypothetical protein